MRQFRGEVAAITGAGSGTGRALAMELGRRGCALAPCDIDADLLSLRFSSLPDGALRFGRRGRLPTAS